MSEPTAAQLQERVKWFSVPHADRCRILGYYMILHTVDPAKINDTWTQLAIWDTTSTQGEGDGSRFARHRDVLPKLRAIGSPIQGLRNPSAHLTTTTLDFPFVPREISIHVSAYPRLYDKPVSIYRS
jgi:hypothetical protein